MKEVFVLYGRVNWSSGIFCEWSNEYFGESPALELFEDFPSAYRKESGKLQYQVRTL